MRPQQSIMRPQYFVFEWLLMSALLYYNKFYKKFLVTATLGVSDLSQHASFETSTSVFVGGLPLEL